MEEKIVVDQSPLQERLRSTKAVIKRSCTGHWTVPVRAYLNNLVDLVIIGKTPMMR